MKIKSYHILIASFLFFFIIAGLQSTYAQEAGGPIFDAYEPELDKERERVMYSPGEASEPPLTKSTSTVTTSTSARKDSVRVRPNTSKSLRPAEEASKNASKGKGEDDSILSFNFLYYIIQKYKLQDIVD